MPDLYGDLIKPLLFRLSPETAHHVAMSGLSMLGHIAPLREAMRRQMTVSAPREVLGIKFPNAVGLAAGFDKNALVLPAWESLGFGFVEAGTITAKPQPGNPQPRLFRVPEQRVLINRMGFNNDGADAVAKRLSALKNAGRWPNIPVGINIGKSKVTELADAPGDYLHSFRALRNFADYVVINVSSPNTPGLRSLQAAPELERILAPVMEEKQSGIRVPVLVKLAPDLAEPDVEEIIQMGERIGVDGWVATNTTIDHSSIPEEKRTQGGLSGAPLRERATAWIKFLRSVTSRPLIASGGVMDADAAAEKMAAGASLVQVYTGFIYAGPGLVPEIARRVGQEFNR